MKKYIHQYINLLAKYWRWLAGRALALVFAVIVLIAVCWQIITPYGQYIQANAASIKNLHISTGLVLGAGVNKDGKPFKELQARLDSAADALNRGDVEKLILSGDNRYSHYNEPAAMKDYLINQKHVDRHRLFLDYAGRSTYESCERANKIFGQTRLIIFSAHSHLPRAIYLCRHFGIDAYGVSSGVEANNSTRRELLARVKAVYNIYVMGEHTVLGPPIPI